jgi:hypothetical protein
MNGWVPVSSWGFTLLLKRLANDVWLLPEHSALHPAMANGWHRTEYSMQQHKCMKNLPTAMLPHAGMLLFAALCCVQ